MKSESLVRKTIQTVAHEGPRSALVKGAHRVNFLIDAAIAARDLRFEARRTPGLEQSLDVAYDFRVGEVTIAPAQIRSEIQGFLERLRSDPPRAILEIGTARGGTLFLLSRIARTDAVLASIDLPGGEFGGGYGLAGLVVLKALPRKGQRLKLMRADSHDPRTLELTRQWFGDRPLDVLLIDGDHRLDGVRRDFLMYGPIVRPGGLIAVHDIVPGPADKVGGVPHFWELIKNSYPSHEFVRDRNQGGFGIGVVEVPPSGIRAEPLLADAPCPDRPGKPEPLA